MDVALVMFREDGTRREFPIPFGKTSIGRNNDCQIRIPLAEVSRHHAEIILEEDRVVLKDLSTVNGTFLNNRRVQEEDLEPGDQIVIGPVVFTVRIDGDPSEDELIEIRTKLTRDGGQGAAALNTSKHVYISDEEIDPIAALEALASSADQTAIEPEDDE